MNELISRAETSALKGIAILLVVVQHIGQAYHISVVNPLGPIGVFLFLFLSGYGVACSYQNHGRRKYFQKKIVKVYLPYVVALLMFLLWEDSLQRDMTVNAVARYLLLLDLPQGSHWYLVLIFCWYVLFYFLTYIYDNSKLLIPLLFIGSLLIIIAKDFQRVYVWQFFSFPLGVISGKYAFCEPKQFAGKTVGAVLLFVSVVCVLLKKTPFVEARELGMADTVLQILLTLALGGWLLLNRDAFLQMPFVRKIILTVGEISYELFLSHVIALDYLKANPSVTIFIRYAIITISGTFILVAFNRCVVKPCVGKL